MDSTPSAQPHPAKKRRALCPICKKAPSTPETRPFCSRHCADVDLGRWFGGQYSVPAEDQDGAAEETLRALGKNFSVS